jgi:hypothetical protein
LAKLNRVFSRCNPPAAKNGWRRKMKQASPVLGTQKLLREFRSPPRNSFGVRFYLEQPAFMNAERMNCTTMGAVVDQRPTARPNYNEPLIIKVIAAFKRDRSASR